MEGLGFDVVYCSVLERAIKTGMNILEGLDQMHVPMLKHWRLNERHYGSLQVPCLGLKQSSTMPSPLSTPRSCLARRGMGCGGV